MRSLTTLLAQESTNGCFIARPFPVSDTFKPFRYLDLTELVPTDWELARYFELV